MVGLLAGALGTGIGQAAGSVADIAKGYIDDERKVDLQRQFADIELEKQNRLDEARKAREYEYKLKENDPNGQYVANAMKTSNLEAKQAAQNFIDQTRTPGYLGAVKSKALATHVSSDSSGSGLPAGVKAQLSNIDGSLKSLRENKYKAMADPNVTPEVLQRLEDQERNLLTQRGMVLQEAGVIKVDPQKSLDPYKPGEKPGPAPVKPKGGDPAPVRTTDDTPVVDVHQGHGSTSTTNGPGVTGWISERRAKAYGMPDNVAKIAATDPNVSRIIGSQGRSLLQNQEFLNNPSEYAKQQLQPSK